MNPNSPSPPSDAQNGVTIPFAPRGAEEACGWRNDLELKAVVFSENDVPTSPAASICEAENQERLHRGWF